jgi:hypothetical protein
VHRHVDPFDDAPVDVDALHGSREVETATQQRGRVGHRPHHRPRLAAALDQLVQQLACLALAWSMGIGSMRATTHLRRVARPQEAAGRRTFYPYRPDAVGVALKL